MYASWFSLHSFDHFPFISFVPPLFLHSYLRLWHVAQSESAPPSQSFRTVIPIALYLPAHTHARTMMLIQILTYTLCPTPFDRYHRILRMCTFLYLDVDVVPFPLPFSHTRRETEPDPHHGPRCVDEQDTIALVVQAVGGASASATFKSGHDPAKVSYSPSPTSFTSFTLPLTSLSLITITPPHAIRPIFA